LAAVGGKLLYDRAVLPRAWIETAGVDPDLPIRGRYVSLNLVLPAVEESPLEASAGLAYGRIEVRGGRALAVLAGGNPVRDATHPIGFVRNVGQVGARWHTLVPVAFFLSEDARDPTLGRRPGELWVEATLPSRGAPRPVRLGILRGDRIEPLG
ncbi:MAG TPA: hypothetical protein VFI92_12355, partial [Steroidobacteraceae bacterium]|nr:hypothetical protein [Steroidobacteraceae bacterium]